MLHPQRSRHLLCCRPFRPSLRLLLPTIQTRPISTVASLLNLCTSPRHLQQVHSRFILHGLHQNPTLCSELMDRYASLGLLDISEKVFRSVNCSPNFTVYSSMIRNLSKTGEFERALSLYQEMVLKGMFLDADLYPFVLESCSCLCDVGSGMRIHAKLVKLGLESSDSVAEGLLEMYRRCGYLCSEQFDLELKSAKDLLICDDFGNGNPEAAFSIFKRMRLEGCLLDSATIVKLFRSCVDLSSLRLGRIFHSLAIVSNFSNDLLVNTALLSMYSKLGSLENAQLVFDKMPEWDCVVWNITISAYARNGYPKKSVDLFRSMNRFGRRPDLFTVMALIPAVSQLKSLDHGKELHAYIIRNSLDYQVSVCNSVMGMYCDCNCLDYALKVFDSLAEKKKETNVSWSTMIKGYVANDRFLDSVKLFSRMRSEGVEVDFVTIINVLPAYVNIGALQQVKNLHSFAAKSGLDLLPSVVTAILVSYAKSGSIEMAGKLFDAKEESSRGKDVISWNAMIGAYAKHGDWPECFDLYDRMKRSNLRPDSTTFIGLLTACVNSGRIEDGKEYFKEMTETHGLVPGQEHYAIMVDLLGRAGRIGEARELISSMPFKPDARVWGPLLSACRDQSETELAELAAEKLIEMEPGNAGNYVLLSNVYAASGKWEGVAKMRRVLRDKCLKKNLGCSWVEINGKVSEFRVADRSNDKWEDMYGVLGSLEMEIKEEERVVL